MFLEASDVLQPRVSGAQRSQILDHTYSHTQEVAVRGLFQPTPCTHLR